MNQFFTNNSQGVTYGGIKRAQEFIREKLHFKMPFIEVCNEEDIIPIERYNRLVTRRGEQIIIDSAIKKNGAMTKVLAARLIKGNKYSLCFDGDSIAIGPGYENYSEKLFEFMFKDENQKIFLNISRYGIPYPTDRDKLEFRFYPETYKNRIFI